MRRLPILFVLALAFAALISAGPQKGYDVILPADDDSLANDSLLDAFFAEVDTTEADSTLGVVAWFGKGDSVTYDITTQEGYYLDDDTTFTSLRHCMASLTVIDSTAQGYRVQYCLLSDSTDGIYGDDDPQGFNALSRGIIAARVGKPVVLQLSELGVIEHLEGWQAYRDAYKAEVTRLVSSLWSKLSTSDDVISQGQLVGTIMQPLSDEEGVIKELAGANQIFELHSMMIGVGQQFETDTVNANGTREHDQLMATYEQHDSDQADSTLTDFAGDYCIASINTTTPGTMALDDFVGQQAEQLDQDLNLPDSVKFTEAKTLQAQVNRYFFNGWLKNRMFSHSLQTTCQDLKGNKHRVGAFMETEIEWDTARWPQAE